MVGRPNKALRGEEKHLAAYSATLTVKLFLVPERSGPKTEFSKIALNTEYSTVKGLLWPDLHEMLINRPNTAFSTRKYLRGSKTLILAFKWLLVPARSGTKSKIHEIAHERYLNKIIRSEHVNK